MAQQPISLEKPVGEEDDSALGDFIEDIAAESPFETRLASRCATRHVGARAGGAAAPRARGDRDALRHHRRALRARSRRSARPSTSRASASARSRTTRSRSCSRCPRRSGCARPRRPPTPDAEHPSSPCRTPRRPRAAAQSPPRPLPVARPGDPELPHRVRRGLSGPTPLNSLSTHGGVSEWLKEIGCKPIGSAYAGSNPAPTITIISCLVRLFAPI